MERSEKCCTIRNPQGIGRIGLVRDIQAARLTRGGSLDYALIIGQKGPLNLAGMRFDDEPIRHTLLDAMGDLMLLGGLPWAELRLTKPGHALLHGLAHEAGPLCVDSDARSLVTRT